MTVAENENGAFSYQGEDKDENRTYVDKDTKDNGQIIIKQTEGTTTDNTVTVEENVTNKNGDRDVDIIIDGVNVDTSTQTEALPDTGSTGDKTIIKVGEGAKVDLTVKDSNLTTGGNGIDIGVNLKGEDENKGANVDLTLDHTKVNLTQNGKAGINVQDNSNVDLTLKGENAIDGSKATEKREYPYKECQCRGYPCGRWRRR